MPSIVRTDDVLGGDLRIEGTRIGVLHVYDLVISANATPEEAADQLDIDLAAVYAALSYYYDNPDEMERTRERHATLEEGLGDRTLRPPKTAE